ncbi:hypothetical protein [Alicyclobacillus sp. ALC3]|uniref:hypothetical protein n=1 Tax=Alicyclobacillus sp. ALC3 TaxID=2796143 RepID=UPI002378B529|nr:hypothetical protein [Alicyclobacillus sp. ALC3]WDL96623.1 hypothetical protein JC200_20300 [Alicyclobacillus sp. ALC3]
MQRKATLIFTMMGIFGVLGGLGISRTILSSSQISRTTSISLPEPPGTVVNWQTNGVHHERFVQIVRGTLSTEETGVIKTDTNCTPDALGLSHCQNILALPHNKTLVVTDIHNMQNYRCLKVGETVIVKPVNSNWAKVVVRE